MKEAIKIQQTFRNGQEFPPIATLQLALEQQFELMEESATEAPIWKQWEAEKKEKAIFVSPEPETNAESQQLWHL